MIDVIANFEWMAQPPAHGPEFEAWLTMADALGLLRDNAADNDFLAYASDQWTYVKKPACQPLPL